MPLQGSGILIQSQEAAATLTLGVDAFRNERKRVSSRTRFIDGIAVVGSAVLQDCSVDLYIEDYYVGRFSPSRIGVVAPLYPDDVQPIRPATCPPGSQLTCIIADAPATNPLIVTLYGVEK